MFSWIISHLKYQPCLCTSQKSSIRTWKLKNHENVTWCLGRASKKDMHAFFKPQIWPKVNHHQPQTDICYISVSLFKLNIFQVNSSQSSSQSYLIITIQYYLDHQKSTILALILEWLSTNSCQSKVTDSYKKACKTKIIWSYDFHPRTRHRGIRYQIKNFSF